MLNKNPLVGGSIFLHSPLIYDCKMVDLPTHVAPVKQTLNLYKILFFSIYSYKIILLNS